MNTVNNLESEINRLKKRNDELASEREKLCKRQESEVRFMRAILFFLTKVLPIALLVFLRLYWGGLYKDIFPETPALAAFDEAFEAENQEIIAQLTQEHAPIFLAAVLVNFIYCFVSILSRKKDFPRKVPCAIVAVSITLSLALINSIQKIVAIYSYPDELGRLSSLNNILTILLPTLTVLFLECLVEFALWGTRLSKATSSPRVLDIDEEIQKNSQSIESSESEIGQMKIWEEEKMEEERLLEKRDCIKKDALKELNGLIGLSSLKQQVKNWETIENQKRIRGDKTLSNLNFVFSGNPGTGKTTVARLMGKILYGLGLVTSPEVIEIKKGDLSSMYVGEMMEKTEKFIKKAEGKTLFIDEAPQLVPSEGNCSNSEGDALRALMNALEANKGRQAFIFAGYESGMQKLYRFDQGLESRLPKANRFYFEDYNAQELMQIVKLCLEKKSYTLESSAEPYLLKYITRIISRPDFGNARAAENIADELYKAQLQYDGDNGAISYVINADVARALCLNEENSHPKVSDFENRAKVLAEAESDLNKLIGLDTVKDKVIKWKNVAEFDIELQKRGKTSGEGKASLNFAFVGGPGTGKTEVARIMGKIFYGLNLTSSPRVDVITSSDLIGQYKGHTGPKARDRIAKSKGATLFIDEAYTLYGKKSVEDGDFAKEAVKELITAMEDKEERGSRAFILAGYKKEMEELLREGNKGFLSRVEKIEFPDYSPTELVEILKSMLRKDSFSIDPDAFSVLEDYFVRLKEKEGGNFGNARDARKVKEALEQIHKSSWIKSKNDDTFLVITLEDCNALVQESIEDRQ